MIVTPHPVVPPETELLFRMVVLFTDENLEYLSLTAGGWPHLDPVGYFMSAPYGSYRNARTRAHLVLDVPPEERRALGHRMEQYWYRLRDAGFMVGMDSFRRNKAPRFHRDGHMADRSWKIIPVRWKPALEQ